MELKIQDGKLLVEGEMHLQRSPDELFEVLRFLLKRYRDDTERKHPFFTGGAIGYWGYEMAALFEKIKFRSKSGGQLPDLSLGFYRDLLVFDHRKRTYYLVTNVYSQKALASRDKETLAGKSLSRLEKFISGKRERNHKEERDGDNFHLKNFRPDIPKTRFEKIVRRTQSYIRAGDIYQANLSQRFQFRFKGSSLRLYDQLRQINPSPFASFLKLRDLEILSSSPERLIRKRGNSCETLPIAGTRPRQQTGKTEKGLVRELLSHPKERAEHIMLVDLERNDLGRVCDWPTIQVKEMMKIERYSHVVHMVSRITGRLKKDKDGFDLISAMFPGGTITGCPKVRCMEIIDELEPMRRGIYTGSIGYIDFRGDLDLNIVIRTLVLEKARGYLQVGAGIVVDSDPAREYEETIHKGEALTEALVQASAG